MIYKTMELELSNLNNFEEILKLKKKYQLERNIISKDLHYFYDEDKKINFIINKNTLEIKHFLLRNPLYNFKGYNYLVENISKISSSCTIMEYFEGKKFFCFNHNGIWNLVHKNKLINNNSTLYNLFHSLMSSDLQKLNQNYVYYFIYLDCNEKKIVDYTNLFGENYKKIMFLYYTYQDKFYFTDEILEKNLNFEKPKTYQEISEINLESNKIDFSINPVNKGVIIFINDNTNTILKLQNFKYQFYKAIGPKKHIYNGFIDLYKKGKLIDFMKNKYRHTSFDKIINPYNNSETFDTIGCIDSLFKNLSNELFNIFTHFYSIKHKKIKFSIQYKHLPLLYKLIIKDGIKKNLKSIHDFYNYLKIMNLEKTLELIKTRKLFNNWISQSKENFSFIFNKNNKLRNKLAAVYVSKLFPEIIKSEINYKK